MLDLVWNIGMLAFEAYSAFSNDETDSNLASVVGVGGSLVLGAGALICNLLSDEEKQDGDDEEDDEILNLLIGRLKFAKVCVSLWSHCCMADGEFNEQEYQLTDELIGSLFDDHALFPEEIANQEVIYKELIDTFNNPLPMKEVIELAQSSNQLAANFYEEACIIFSTDEDVSNEEHEFLDELAHEFRISRMDKKQIERKYLAVT